MTALFSSLPKRTESALLHWRRRYDTNVLLNEVTQCIDEHYTFVDIKLFPTSVDTERIVVETGERIDSWKDSRHKEIIWSFLVQQSGTILLGGSVL